MTDAVAANKSQSLSKGQGRILRIWLWRLLLLVAGGSLSWLLGVSIACFYPSPAPEMPLLQRVWLYLGHSPASENRTTPLPIAGTAPASSSSLTPAQRNKLKAELKQLQAQLQNLRDRTTVLETQLSNRHTSEPLEVRLSHLTSQLQSEPDLRAAGSGLPSKPLMVTLPSDLLFKDHPSAIQPESHTILDNLIADLKNYQGATIFIAAHTDSEGEAQDNRVRSFRRAQAVQQYLNQTLGDRYHWVALGYGESRPINTNDTSAKRQRNRRIEIAVEQ